MKKFSLIVLAAFVAAFMCMSVTAMAAEGKAVSKAMTMEGYIIDSKCAKANKDKLEEFTKTHPKECSMLPDCKKSGYNLYSEGKLHRFDKASNKKLAEFLEKADSTLHVKAEVEHGKGGVLKLISIANAE